MVRYPLVIRNKVPLVVRAFMLAWLAGVVAITWSAVSTAAPEGHWWPWILGFFWACGIVGVVASFRQEAATVRVEGPGSIRIRRGPAFARREEWVAVADLCIEDTKDSEGAAYHKLWLATLSEPVVIAEAHRRQWLEQLQRRFESAVAIVPRSGQHPRG